MSDNNGNLLKQQLYIPGHQMRWQQYDYDSLNRLNWAREVLDGGAEQWKQQFTYDRWGNRTINTGVTYGTGINNKAFTVNTANNRLGVPGGQSGVMTYDVAGNLTNDTYTGMGGRTYDAENKITQAADNTGQISRYTYDGEGKRVRRQVASSQEDWQVYGFAGELLAEYRASSPASSPQKEYGYRNGQLLVTATGRFNVALAANGAVATASSTATGSGFSTTGAINGNYRGPWGNGVEGWNDNTPNSVPDWIQVDFAGSKTIDEISVFSLHDNYTQENTPTETQTFTLYGLLNFNVEYWNGSSWVTVPGGSVTANNKVWRKFTFSPITTSKIRVYITAVPDAWSRVVEIQAFGTSVGDQKVQWLISDHLGTPRMVLDQTGSLANMKRHDYLPFGEELFAPTSGRSAAQGYAGGDGVRQQFTSKERDVETGLDYFLARYYSSTQARFTSPDEFSGGPRELFFFADSASANPTFYSDLTNPQSLNKYQYAYNNPLRFIDPDGHDVIGYKLLTSGPNQVPKTDKREVRDVSTLGFKDESRGGYALFNLQVDFDKGDNIADYKHVRAAVILGSPSGEGGTIRNAGAENPGGSQMAVSGQSRFVSDNPGVTVSGMPKAGLSGTAFTAIFAAGEYNTKTGQLSQNVAYYGVKIAFGKDGKIDQSKSVVTRISRDEFIKLAKQGGASVPKDKNKKECPECLLSPPNAERR